jgi:hypothetical protein
MKGLKGEEQESEEMTLINIFYVTPDHNWNAYLKLLHKYVECANCKRLPGKDLHIKDVGGNNLGNKAPVE